MRFGLLYEAQRPFKGTSIDWNTLYKETLEQCVLAERVGFDNLWFVEHHFLTGFSGSPCPEVLLGALSQLTKRIRIGFGVCILPAHHPIRVAERTAMIDQLTDGRLEVGTGRSNAYEQIGQGIDPRKTREMWEESIAMLPRIWQSDEFSWEGKFWSVPKRRVLPKPFQKPHPPLYLACTQTESFDVAAEKGSVCCPRRPSPPRSWPATWPAIGNGSRRRRPWGPPSTTSGATTSTRSVGTTTPRRVSWPPSPSRPSSARTSRTFAIASMPTSNC